MFTRGPSGNPDCDWEERGSGFGIRGSQRKTANQLRFLRVPNPESRTPTYTARVAGWVPKCLVVLFAVIALLASRALGAAPKPTLKSVGQKVYCTCGCVTTLEHCPHPPSECARRAEMEALVLKDIDAGKDEPAILKDFVDRYGVPVLAAPPAKGFDLTAWILPRVGLIVGLVAVIVIVRRMRKPTSEVVETPAQSIDPKVLAAVEEEMKTSGLGSRG
ncbi:MAG: cytochrome c-type biogenesis protein CcmH [Terriglobia bacterium]